MNDMSAVIVPKSDQLNSDTLIAGPLTIQITDVDIRPGTEQPVSIHFQGEDGQPWKPCKSMSRVLVAAWGPDAKEYIGRWVTLYRDPKVKWGGLAVGGIRVSHMSDIDPQKVDGSGVMMIALTETKGKRAPYVVKPFVKPSTAELTIDQARSDIEFAATLDELKTVWSRKAMGPFRAELQADLDARKTALAEPETGRPVEEMGEGHTDDETKRKAQVTANDIKTRADNATTAEQITNLTGVLETERGAFTQAQVDEVEMALSDARARL